MSMVARLEPRARNGDILRTVLVLLLPLVLAYPVFLLVGVLSLGDPAGCMPGQDPSTCGVAGLELARTALLTLTVWIPIAVFVVTLAVSIVLLVRRRRSFPVAAIGIALMAILTFAGLIYRVLEL